jgi:RNA polymerase sigma factor (sigma-70 family)
VTCSADKTPVYDPGSEETLEEFLERMRPRLKQLLRNCRVPPQDAEDVLQETFADAFGRWDTIRHKEAWLIGTLRYKCAVYWKKLQDDPLETMDTPLLEGLSQPRPPDQVREEVLCDLRNLTRGLGKKHQAVLWLRYGVGLSTEEVAERLGYCPSSIRKLSLRSLARLQKRAASLRGGSGPSS